METKIIGNKIAQARKKLGISQSQLADQLFISAQAVGKWERGESMPDIITLNKLAVILNVDLNYFSEKFEPLNQEAVLKSDETITENHKNQLSWNMSNGNWVDADFSGLKSLHEKFSSSNMKNCKFVSSDLSGLKLRRNHIDNCDFSNSDISCSNIQSSHLVKNNFKNCSLKESEFSVSHITDCDFTSADFTGVKFKTSHFANNLIGSTICNQIAFTGTSLDNIIFEGTIENCSFENCGFRKVKFQNTVLLNTFFKNNKKLKQVQFIDCKVDKLTYAFLQNGKANLSGVILITT